MLRDSARQFVRDRYPPDRVATLADGSGFDRSEWRALAEMGWTGISVPEADGGAGLSFFEEMILAEELGRGLYPGPFFGSVVLALPLLRATGGHELVAGLVVGERVATVAWAGPEGAFDVDPAPKVTWEGDRLTCVKLFVPDLAAADLVVVLGSLPDGTGAWPPWPPRPWGSDTPPSTWAWPTPGPGSSSAGRSEPSRPCPTSWPRPSSRSRPPARSRTGPVGPWPRTRTKPPRPRRRRRPGRPTPRSPRASGPSRCTAAPDSHGTTRCTGGTSGPWGSRRSWGGEPSIEAGSPRPSWTPTAPRRIAGGHGSTEAAPRPRRAARRGRGPDPA